MRSALVKGSLYLLIVGGVGHMLHNEEQVIAVFFRYAPGLPPQPNPEPRSTITAG